MKLYIVIIGTLLIFATSAQADITVTGTMKSANGRKALVNGNLYGINDKMDGYTIIAIDQAGIRVEKNGKVLDCPITTASSSKDKSFDKKPRKFFAKWRKSEPKPAEKVAPPARSQAKRTSSSDSSKKVDKILNQKMREADRYFSDFKSEATRLLRTLPSNISNSQAVRISSEFQKVTGKYQSHMQTIQLPCSATPSYDSWIRQRRKEEKEIIDSWNKAVESKARGRGRLKVRYN